MLPTLSICEVFIHEGGLFAVADHLEAVAVAWGASAGLIHLGRQLRDVKPPERKPRRTKE
jgi:hypothetical protein